MRTKTSNDLEAAVAQVTDRLTSIGSTLAAEKADLEALRIRRLNASLAGRKDDLSEIDTQITRAERNISDLIKLREGVEPMVSDINDARDLINNLERDLKDRRAGAAGLKAFAAVREHLITETLPILNSAIAIHTEAGLHTPPSLTEMKRQIEGRWSGGSTGSYLDRAASHGFTAGIASTEQYLAAARRRLAELASEAIQ